MSETTSETQNKKGLSTTTIVTILVCLIALIAGGYFLYTYGFSNKVEAVATVNGTPIERGDYERSVRQISDAYATQGIDPNSTEIRDAINGQAISTLINRRLMKDAATKASISVTDAEVDAAYQNLAEGIGGSEALSTILSETNMTDADLMNELREDILINKYLESVLGFDMVSISDEEVQVAYDEATTGVEGSESDSIPPLEEVRELIREQLMNDRKQQAIATELERLRAEADIQVLI